MPLKEKKLCPKWKERYCLPTIGLCIKMAVNGQGMTWPTKKNGSNMLQNYHFKKKNPL